MWSIGANDWHLPQTRLDFGAAKAILFDHMTAGTPLSKEVDQYSLVLQRSFLQQLFDILNLFGKPTTAANRPRAAL